MSESARRGHLPPWAVLAGALALVAVACVATPLVGATQISLARVFDTSIPLDLNPDRIIFFELRLPRLVFALVTGASLALAGAVFQGLLRNDLATPYTLGVSGGSTLGALVALYLAPATLAVLPLTTVGALLGGAVAVTVILLIASRAGTANRVGTLLLAGVTMNLIFGAAIQVVQFKANPFEVFAMIRWMMGGLDGVGFGTSAFLGVALVAAGAMLMLHAQALNVMTLGDETAAHLGLEPRKVRLRCAIAAAALTALVVSWAGPIGFIGLIVPHAMRRLGGPDHRLLLISSAIAGAGFLALCDGAGRSIGGDQEIPVGIVTAALGGPFFLWILFSKGIEGAREE